MPIIPGFNDDEKNLLSIARICRTLGDTLSFIQLLPYHKYGLQKYERIGRTCRMPLVDSPSKDRMHSIKSIFQEFNLKVSVG